MHLSPLTAEPSKTEAIWFGSSADLDRLADTDVTICLDQATIHPSDCVLDLGVLHVAAYCEGRVNVLFPPPSTSQTTPCSRPRQPKAVGVRVRFDAHRLLQRRSRQPAGQCSETYMQQLGLWQTLGHAIMSRLHSLRCTGYQSINESPILQTVYHDAFCLLRPGFSPVCIYLTFLLHIHICRAVLMHLQSAKNGDNNTPGVLRSFGQRSFVLGEYWTRRLEQSFSGA